MRMKSVEESKVKCSLARNKSMKRVLFSLVALELLFIGCSRVGLEFDALDACVPASLSETYIAKDQRTVVADNYDLIGSFSLRFSSFSFTPFIPAKKVHLSRTLDSIANAYKADAIVNIRFGTTTPGSGHSALRFFSGLLGYCSLGIITFSKIEAIAEGDLVKEKKSE
jgi:hypothetical protein